MTVSPFRNFCLSVGFRCEKARSQEACLDPLLAWCWRYFGAIKPLKHAYQASLAGLCPEASNYLTAKSIFCQTVGLIVIF
jgi:hypothetical protein